MNWENSFSRLGKDLHPSALTELMGFVTSDVIPFSGGLPHPATFPVEQVKEVMDYILSHEPIATLQYGSTQGYRKLIDFLKIRSEKFGIQSEHENYLITSGSQQALDLLARLFLDPGDEIIIESPTYLGALGPFDNQGVLFTAAPMDEKGVIPDALEVILKEKKELGRKVKFIYLIPTFQNPTGVTLETERRRRVVDLAKEYEVLVIEDDPYGELRYAGDPIPPIKSFDTDGHVIYLSTFSKIFSPGARMGWIIAHQDIIKKLIYLKESVDLHSSTLIQSLVYEYCHRDYLNSHIQEIIPMYAVRRQAMLEAMEEHFPGDVHWTRPDGGFFVWVTLPKHMDTKEMLPKAVANKVAYVPGYAFYADGSGHNTMRLSFSATSEEEIREGIKRLAEVINSYRTK